MNFLPLLLKLERSQEYTTFKAAHPESFICAGFFIRDFKDGCDQTSIDLCDAGTITTFTPQGAGFQTKEEEILDKTKPLIPFDIKIQVDVEQIKPLVEQQLTKNKVTQKLEKIIAVLQGMPGKGDLSGENSVSHTVWNLTCMLEGMKIILIHIDAKTQEILKFENRSLFDFVRPSTKKG